MATDKDTKTEIETTDVRNVPVPDPVAKIRQERAKDYGQHVAADDIYHEGALAYKAGDPVPASNVKRHGYDQTDPPLVKPAKKRGE